MAPDDFLENVPAIGSRSSISSRKATMRIVDLSVAIKAGIASEPPSMLPRIKYLDHHDGAKEFMAWFPGLKAEQLPDGEGAAMEEITFTTHNGTHLDAPNSTSGKSPTAMSARPTM